ncbi:PREDICTED: probable ethanolamine kinase [Amphimedon queenslandica]|uniref:ethanolamine kinase n=1 Tax=Amphimedon queenslandica TaxID=400682 RepID=A0A1X7UM85_AMPQE|nr:PREDICTED: probable ethanolamine kinase [Amphimedon queenslandica]|eukprot:XP_003387510.1 PREDICTED: probable ethanolamine kinase [Amphimedon queenslandica]
MAASSSSRIEKRTNGGLTWSYVPITINPKELLSSFRTHLCPLLRWGQEEELSTKEFTDGITNTLIGVYRRDRGKDDMVLIRFNGQDTEIMIDRVREITTMLLLSDLRLSTKLHCQFDNGIAYGYVPGRPVTIDEMSDPAMCRRIAKTLARFHKVQVPESLSNGKSRLLNEFFTWFDKIPDTYSKDEDNEKYLRSFGGSTDPLKREVEELTIELEKLSSPLVLCHNDLLCGNIIYNEEEDNVSFIDFEYAGLNPRAYDIADHFCEFVGIDIKDIDYTKYPGEELQKKWLRMYLTELKGTSDISDTDLHQLYREVNKYALAAHLMWTIWGLIQASIATIDFDYLTYSSVRYNEYLAKKEHFLSL